MVEDNALDMENIRQKQDADNAFCISLANTLSAICVNVWIPSMISYAILRQEILQIIKKTALPNALLQPTIK